METHRRRVINRSPLGFRTNENETGLSHQTDVQGVQWLPIFAVNLTHDYLNAIRKRPVKFKGWISVNVFNFSSFGSQVTSSGRSSNHRSSLRMCIQDKECAPGCCCDGNATSRVHASKSSRLSNKHQYNVKVEASKIPSWTRLYRGL